MQHDEVSSKRYLKGVRFQVSEEKRDSLPDSLFWILASYPMLYARSLTVPYKSKRLGSKSKL